MPREVEGPPLRTPPNERSSFVRWCGAPRATPFNASPGRQRGNRGTREASTFKITSGGARGLTPYSRTQFRLIWGEGCFELLILKHRFGWKFPTKCTPSREARHGALSHNKRIGADISSLRPHRKTQQPTPFRDPDTEKCSVRGLNRFEEGNVFSEPNCLRDPIQNASPTKRTTDASSSEWSPPASEKVGIVLIWVGPDRELGEERFPSHMVNSVLSES